MSYDHPSKRVLFTLILISAITHLVYYYKPLPNDFPQPYKYRLLCFGADLMTYFGGILEYFNIINRVSIIRGAYHLTVGMFNIRDQNDNIQIYDELVHHVPVRVYRPLNSTRFKDDKIPTIFYYHGGGFFVGNSDILEPVSYLFAKHTQCQVFYVEYRLIPDHKFPAALDDSLFSTKEILKSHKKYNIDLENVVLIGDSAGGNLATVINRKLVEESLLKTKLKVLIYPILQLYDFTLPSYIESMPKRVLGTIDTDHFKNFLHYLTGYEVDDSIFENGHLSAMDKEHSVLNKYVNRDLIPKEYLNGNRSNIANQRNSTLNEKLKEIILHPDVSPLLVDDFTLKEHNALNVFVLTVGHDILRDDSLIYIERLKSLNYTNIKHEHYDHLFHGVFGLLHGPLKFDVSHELMDNVTRHINEILDN